MARTAEAHSMLSTNEHGGFVLGTVSHGKARSAGIIDASVKTGQDPR